MKNFEIFIKEIRKNLIVGHIMTTVKDFIYYEDNENIRDYDILPLKNLKQYWDKNHDKIQEITPDDIISLNLDLLTLIDYFQDKNRNFYFVKHGRDIEGLVHYSDLKKHPVRVLFYILLSNVELKFRQIYEEDEESIKKVISKERSDKINREIKEDKSKNQDLPFIEYLYLSDFLNVAAKDKTFLKKLGISRKKLESFNGLNEIRNWVAHPTRNRLGKRSIKYFLSDGKSKGFELYKLLKNSLRD